jgi:uncharacterized membrane protein YfcA
VIEITPLLLIFACIAAFFAGFVDSIAGGGGLIQVPALLVLFPGMPILTLIGTNKIASASGTVMSSIHYVRTLKVKFKAFLPALLTAFVFSMLGAKALSLLNEEILKPLIVVLLIVIAVYTFLKKDLGLQSRQRIFGFALQIAFFFIAAIIGFYDGFFGPGTGSFLMFCYVSLIGFSFLEGAAFTKLTNLAANLGALIFFIFHRSVLFKLGLPMAVFNVIGNYLGASLAIKKGSGFVRWIFLAVVAGILVQLVPHMMKF